MESDEINKKKLLTREKSKKSTHKSYIRILADVIFGHTNTELLAKVSGVAVI